MTHFTQQEVALLLIDIFDRLLHTTNVQKEIEERFASLPEKDQERVSPEFGAFLSIFLRQQRQIQQVQQKILKNFANLEKEQNSRNKE